ncbi:iron-siderophore ABC transporter substrate-binding protein [Kineosporia sp. J2-2]|uniref:Iron-siderophore ABC transporter substrate-binding protein n=1 Tax=Kineosporia corallincola TaxID=2835133 RepID=A0ABS5TK10_9ACTN|nr:iron-siderophore ABC transporter substrate-binding protein [Kineosporia corallincola]MBT0771435.1 iron-siderophore ABC transporter substrate-binding protein [Kineosporia corallincola]
MFTALRRARTTQVAALTTAALALALSACGTTESSAGSSDTASASTTASGPVEVTDARDKAVKLDAPATKVVSLEWGLTENLLSLGVTPVGAADVDGYNDYDTVVPLDADTADVGERGTPNTDAISALEPDLIVSVTGLTDKVYSQLEEIAPVVVLAGSDGKDPIGYMEKTVNTLAEVTGTQATATTLLSEFDAKVAEGKAALEAAGKAGAPFTMSDGWVQSGTVTIRMYTPTSFFGAVAAELGLDNQYTEGGDEEYGLATIDVEGLTKVTDADSTFLYVEGAAPADSFVASLKDNAIWKKLGFVKNDNVKPIANGIWMFGGPKAAEAYIDTVVENITGSSAS